MVERIIRKMNKIGLMARDRGDKGLLKLIEENIKNVLEFAEEYPKIREKAFKKFNSPGSREVLSDFMPKDPMKITEGDIKVMDSALAGNKKFEKVFLAVNGLDQISTWLISSKRFRIDKNAEKKLKGIEKIVVPEFILKMAKERKGEILGIGRAFITKDKGKKILVVAPTRLTEGTPRRTKPIKEARRGPLKEFVSKGSFEFHSHPASFKKNGEIFERASLHDLLVMDKRGKAEVLLAGKSAKIYLPKEIASKSKLKTTPFVFNVVTSKAEIVKDNEAWRLIRSSQEYKEHKRKKHKRGRRR